MTRFGLGSGRGGCSKLLGAQLRAGLLQGADGFLEREPVRLEQAGGRALAVADDRRQHDGPVDLAPAGLLGGLSCGLHHAQEFRIRVRLGTVFCAHVLEQTAEIARYIRAKPDDVHIAGLEDDSGFGILGQRQQQMLEQDRAMRLLAREPVRPLQALGQIGRHGNRPELFRKRLRHQQLPRRNARVLIAKFASLCGELGPDALPGALDGHSRMLVPI